jgi:hypothetical protein
MQLKNPLIVYLPDSRGVQISRYGLSNTKIGPEVFTYSKLPGLPANAALGSNGHDYAISDKTHGTCPGASAECQAICYAARPVEENGAVNAVWEKNTLYGANIPPIPEECKRLRLHISGDFDSNEYIDAWIMRLEDRPDVVCWAYTRSWRVPSLLERLEKLRALPNMQLFASMDKSITEMPPAGWRRAWIDGDMRAGFPYAVRPHLDNYAHHNSTTSDGGSTYLCPEQTKRKKNCVECGYCIDGKAHDVTFLEH